MTKKILVILFLVGLMLPLPVFAGAPVDVEGSFGYIPFFTGDLKVAGPNLFFPSGDDETWIGHLDGTASTFYTLILHGTDPNADPGHFVSQGTFTGSVLDSDTGTAVIQLTGHQKEGVPWYGTWLINRGTGGLAGVHGQGTWWLDPALISIPGWEPGDPAFAYEGQVLRTPTH